MNIYVGNLSYQTTEDELRALFQEFGEVKSASLIKDKYSGESKGFGFVEMADKDAAMTAIAELNEKEVNGRNLKVNEARPRERNNFRGDDNRGGGFQKRKKW